MKPFQAVLIVVFASLALIAVFIFATFSGGGGRDAGSIEVWGSLSQELMEDVLDAARGADQGVSDLTYKAYPEDELVPALVQAIAAGRGPDLVLFPAEFLVSEGDKLIPISFRSLPRRTFQDTFIEAGEVLVTDAGVLGIPFYIDPMVLFWNRTLFSEAGIARAPRTFSDMQTIAPRLTAVTSAGTLTEGAVALGEWENVRYAKDIFVGFMRGLGAPLVSRVGENVEVALDVRLETGVVPAESSLRFIAAFADPVSPVYSWNRSQPESRTAFTAGTLAMYMGRASDTFAIRAANPNLNFDVAPYPRVGEVPETPTSLIALSIPRGAQNSAGALRLAGVLSGSVVQESLAQATGLPSVRRDALTSNPENPFETTFRDAALNAFVFLDPAPQESDAILKTMLEAVSSGRLRVPEAVRSAQEELEILVGRVQ